MACSCFDLVIFDCDGVLVDSEPIGCRVLAECCGELGLAMGTEESIALFRGRKMADCVTDIERRLDRSTPLDFVAAVRRRMADAFARELRPVKGVADALARIAQRMPVCVASNGPEEKIRLTLGLVGLLHYFDGRIFSAYGANCWKPDPGLFVHAAHSMGANPVRCAVIEDSHPGVRAGMAAGMRVFAYACSQPDADLFSAEGAVCFDNMADLPRLLDMAGE